MKHRFLAVGSILVLSGAAVRGEAPQASPLAPTLTGLGDQHFAVTTASPAAQAFFDQGLRLLYAFNHAEALRAFQEAARLDARCAMAYWGQAQALGPNVNDFALGPDRRARARAATQEALRRKAGASAREAALIEALARRSSSDPAVAQGALDTAYAAAMAEVARRFPDDPDVSVLYAAAVMETMPWNYWTPEGDFKPEALPALLALERVIARNPNHAGALHFHIHMVEGSREPQRAEASADRLAPLMPSAGHIVHMPSHIYMRIGRYADSIELNQRAALADEDYLAQCQAQGIYPVGYYPHNVHFIWYGATMDGRSALAIEAARKVEEKVPHHVAGQASWTFDYPVTTLYAYVRFGRWEQVLTEPAPPPTALYASAIWHYARALAFTARGQLDRARRDQSAFLENKADAAFKAPPLSETFLPGNLEIAGRVIDAEIAAHERRFEDAARLAGEAVALQDGQAYNEPPFWPYPTRHTLGAILLEAGRPDEAARVYAADLARNPENGFSLFGLEASLRALGRDDEAESVLLRFRKAWARADVTLTSSRF